MARRRNRRNPVPRRPRVLQWNTNSLRVRHADLKDLILQKSLEFDVFALQETRVPAENLRLPGFTGYSGRSCCSNQDCNDAPCLDPSHPQHRPRTAIYVRSDIPHTLMDVAQPDLGQLEICAVRVRMGDTDTTVASVYVPPGVPWDPSCLIALHSRLGKDVLICGDFNSHHRAWGNQSSTTRGKKLLDAINAAGLRFLQPTSPTFIRPGRSSFIDLALISDACHYSWARAPDSLGSDHFPIFLNPSVRGRRREKLYPITKWAEFRERVKDIPLAGDFLDFLGRCAKNSTITCAVPLHAPVPDLRLLGLRASRRRAERVAERTHHPEHWKAFRRIDACCRRQANRRSRESWASICRSIQSARQSSAAWRILKSLLQVASNRQPVLGAAIARGISFQDLAEQLADFLSKSATPPPSAGLPVANPPSPLRATPSPPAALAQTISALCNEPIAPHELQRALNRSKKKSAPGADGLTLQMLRNLDAPEKKRLLAVFNDTWDSSILPDNWRNAIVVPILKPRKPAKQLSSYRPVSLTSAACKTMEFIALERLTWIARATNFLPEMQTGFRKHRCTADSIADVVSTLEEAKYAGDIVFLVLLDVQSAFDNLPHTIIEQALDALGVTGKLRSFVSAFLSNRTFQVRVGQTLSSPRPVTSGVPQGSVLSPWLFNLVLAGLPKFVQQIRIHKVSCSIYADDIALWIRAPKRRIVSARKAMQQALDGVQYFLSSKGLTLSATKSEALVYHPEEHGVPAVLQLCISKEPLFHGNAR